MNVASAIAFDSAEREYNDAWSAPSSTRFELPPVDVNKILKERYRLSPEQTLTRAMIWDMETKKAWVSLPNTRFERTDGATRQGSDAQQCLRPLDLARVGRVLS